LRRKDVSSVITGATTIEQLDENLESTDAEDKLTENILERVESVLGNHPDEE